MKRIMLMLLSLALASPCAARIVCVATKKANVRSGPDVAFSVSWVTYRFTPYRVTGSDESWLQVLDVDGSEGWLHSSVVKEDSCVIVVGQKANVREGPGLDERVLWEVELGYPFRVLRGVGGWHEVTDESEVRGWISSDLVWGRTEPVRGEI